MSLLSENVIPGNHGKVFETDAKEHQDLEKIKSLVEQIDGVKDVLIDENVFPKKITIHTSSLVKIKDIEDAAKQTGHHLVPKSIFSL